MISSMTGFFFGEKDTKFGSLVIEIKTLNSRYCELQLKLGDDIDVKVLKFDEELSRLSLGIKQLTENPWENLKSDIQINKEIEAKVIQLMTLALTY